jgi:hypothetical protein
MACESAAPSLVEKISVKISRKQPSALRSITGVLAHAQFSQAAINRLAADSIRRDGNSAAVIAERSRRMVWRQLGNSRPMAQSGQGAAKV